MNRNLKKIEFLLTDYNAIDWIFTKHELKYLQVIHEAYRQQKLMHSNQTHSTTNRIVSIHQPNVRPIVRGKAGSDVEFGSKTGVYIHNGLTYLDHLSWDSYSETEDLKQAQTITKNAIVIFLQKQIKLILCGFHEAALMCHSAFKYMNPGVKFTMKYTTANGVNSF